LKGTTHPKHSLFCHRYSHHVDQTSSDTISSESRKASSMPFDNC
jgi:hypothetical protein